VSPRRRGDDDDVDTVARHEAVEIRRRTNVRYLVGEAAGQLGVVVGDGHEPCAIHAVQRPRDERTERAASDEADPVNDVAACHATVRSSSATPMRASAMP
jgi:hypothetical protein